MKPAAVLSDARRFPAIRDLSYLNALRQHAFAPAFNFNSGDRLTKDDIQAVCRYHGAITSRPKSWTPGETPRWLPGYLARCAKRVPAFRGRSSWIAENPSMGREDLRTAPWNYVADDFPAKDLLVYSTSGTTGSPLDVLFDRITQACYLPQLESVLHPFGVTLERGSDQVAIALICAQQKTLTYASLSAYLDGAGILKLNLNPADWRDPAHRNRFLEAVNPQILTGDPFAFQKLLALKPAITPKALVSSAMALSKGLRRELEACFSCPVIDVYSLTECRMIAFATPAGHQLIRHDLFVEVLAFDRDVPVAPGEPGELTLTGGNNPFLHLIRYRTGDYCRLVHDGERMLFKYFEGRRPVTFQDENGRFINSVDISRALAEFSLAAFTLHQHRDGSLSLCLYGRAQKTAEITEQLKKLFGASLPLTVSQKLSLPQGVCKPTVYSSDLEAPR